MTYRSVIPCIFLCLLGMPLYAVQMSGQLQQWHAVTLTFDGPQSAEQATPNPFLDYRLTVTFEHSASGTQYRVPGFYAADGDAANTSADAGNKWRVHFSADHTGSWTWTASFRKGDKVAVNSEAAAGQSGGFMDGNSGTFTIRPSDKKAPDFRAKGRLKYIGQRYLQFAGTKEYFLKEGADAPENLLAYADYDGDFKTDGKKDNLVKTWAPHVKDWKEGDPTWQDDKGKGLIGALNYLQSEGMNVFSFLTMNIEGDDRNVFPYTSYDERLRLDISRMDQWDIIFSHGQKLGLFLHFKMQETENDQLLDGGELGVERKLYYRELIARFGYHLALNWNLGEENTNTTEQIKAFCQYLKDTDPYDHLIVIHTFPGQYDKVYGPLLGDKSELTGLSIQTKNSDFRNVHSVIKTWVEKSTDAGKPWAVACDEPGDAKHALLPDKDNPEHNNARMNALWGTLMAGGWGCEWYFGYQHAHSDLSCQDFRSRDLFWDQCRYALEFFKKQNIPFWDMTCNDNMTWQKNDYCFSKAGEIYLIYQKQGGLLNLDLQGGASYTSGYFNPRTGEGLVDLLDKQFMKLDIKNKTYFRTFKAPDAGDWLLVIRTDGGKVSQSEQAPREPQVDAPQGAALSALDDFKPVEGGEFVPYYTDKAHKALAIDAKKYKDTFAAAETVYKGKDGTYTLVIVAMSETDGESTYKLTVNGKPIGQAQNPRATEDYQPVYHTFKDVTLKNGDTIQVQFNSASNRLLPEGSGFAYSRGRWSQLIIADAKNVAGLTEPKATAKKAVIESLYTGQIFEEDDGLLAVEAEHFIKQDKTEKRKWYITTADTVPGIAPDGDGSHGDTASGGAYIEILPDTRRSQGNKLIKGENFTENAGTMAVVSYPVYINNPGRYYIWARAYSSGSEDNGLHVGLDGDWPESGQRLQWCQGKNAWRWESKQRTDKQHCGEPYKIYLDIETPGMHMIEFSMREDGFEFDKWLMTQDKEFQRPDDAGPDETIKK